MEKKDTLNEIEFIEKLKTNDFSIPNQFTLEMGKLIKKAREEKGMSQSQFAKAVSRRQATISDIENGKSEIGVFTLVSFALSLNKPISYFFPETLLKEIVSEVKSPTEQEILMMFQELEYIGGADLALKQIRILVDYFQPSDEVVNDE